MKSEIGAVSGLSTSSVEKIRMIVMYDGALMIEAVDGQMRNDHDQSDRHKFISDFIIVDI